MLKIILWGEDHFILVKIAGSKTTAFLKMSLIYFYTGIFLELSLNFYGIVKAV